MFLRPNFPAYSILGSTTPSEVLLFSSWLDSVQTNKADRLSDSSSHAFSPEMSTASGRMTQGLTDVAKSSIITSPELHAEKDMAEVMTESHGQNDKAGCFGKMEQVDEVVSDKGSVKSLDLVERPEEINGSRAERKTCMDGKSETSL